MVLSPVRRGQLVSTILYNPKRTDRIEHLLSGNPWKLNLKKQRGSLVWFFFESFSTALLSYYVLTFWLHRCWKLYLEISSIKHTCKMASLNLYHIFSSIKMYSSFFLSDVELKEHKELIPLIGSSSSPNIIRTQTGCFQSSQHKRKLRSLVMCPTNDQLFVTRYFGHF